MEIRHPYSDLLAKYVQNVIDKAMHILPACDDFVSWFAQCELELRSRPIAIETDKAKKEWLRDRYDVIATRLLPLFEGFQKGWCSVSFLNLTPTTPNDSLTQHFAKRKDACPNHLQRFICDVAAVFGTSLI